MTVWFVLLAVSVCSVLHFLITNVLFIFHSNGRAVHYNGSSLLQWKSVRLDVTLNSGDIAGIGWERQGDSPPLPGQTVKGIVYFTHNGRRLAPTLDDVAGGMWPVVHIQKKVGHLCKVKV